MVTPPHGDARTQEAEQHRDQASLGDSQTP